MTASFENSRNFEEKKGVLQSELEINKQMQEALQQRILTVKEYKGPIPATFFSQTYKDQIELDELKIRELELIVLIKEMRK